MLRATILSISLLTLLVWSSAARADFLQEASERAFSVEELATFNGVEDDKPIYIALKGIVFDVSAGADYYKPGAGYHSLAGKDASRTVALPSMKPEDLNDRCDDLTPEQQTNLDELFTGVYIPKYPIVGHLAGGFFYPNGLCCKDEVCQPCPPPKKP